LIFVVLECFGSYRIDYIGSELARITGAIQYEFLSAHGTEFAGHSTSAWVIQQLREAFPYDSVPG
jgi:hypothetical protein